MIIDVHTHLNNYDESQSVPLSRSLVELQESMQVNGVDCASVLTSCGVGEHRRTTVEEVDLAGYIDSLHVVAGVGNGH